MCGEHDNWSQTTSSLEFWNIILQLGFRVFGFWGGIVMDSCIPNEIGFMILFTIYASLSPYLTNKGATPFICFHSLFEIVTTLSLSAPCKSRYTYGYSFADNSNHYDLYVIRIMQSAQLPVSLIQFLWNTGDLSEGFSLSNLKHISSFLCYRIPHRPSDCRC